VRLHARLLCTMVAMAAPVAVAADDLVYREVLKGDQRMYDNFRAFAGALRAALGGEPKMSRLEVSENTGSALVRLDDGRVRSFAFVEGALSERRVPLQDEAPPEQALSKRFGFDAVDLDRVRAALKVQRAKPGHRGDSSPRISVGSRALKRRSLVGIEVGSMAIQGLDLLSYDLDTGEPVDLKGMLARANAEIAEHNRRVEAQARAFEEEEKRLSKIDMLGFGSDAVIALQRDTGPAPRLRNVVLVRDEVRLTLADARAGGELVTYRYDRRGMLSRRDSRESEITRCEQPFAADDFDWPRVPQMVQQAFATLNIARDAAIRVDVERTDRCGPVHAQVSLSKDGLTLSAFFDVSGRLYHVE